MNRFARLGPVLLGAAAFDYLALSALGAYGLVMAVALGAAVPFACGAALDELDGVWCLFTGAAYADTLDDVFGLRLAVFAASFVCGLVYLVRRRRQLGDILHTPVALALALFLVEELLSGWAFGAPELRRLAVSRATVFLTFACAAVLTRRPRGRQLLPAVVLAAAAASVAVCVRELAAPGTLGLPVSLVDHGRAGGLYAQPNVAGIAFVFALAFAAALFMDRAIGRRTLGALGGLLGIGILCTVSRGAFITALAVCLFTWLASLRLRVGGRGLAVGMLLALALVAMAARPLGQALADAGDRVDPGIVDLSRLTEVTRALTGSPDALLDDDSSRLELVSLALTRIEERPWFGYGTGAFMQDDLRSHVELLEVVGENGLAGGALYALLLGAVALSLFRLRGRTRLAAALVCGAWLLTNFDNHNLMESPLMIVPLGYLVGLGEA